MQGDKISGTASKFLAACLADFRPPHSLHLNDQIASCMGSESRQSDIAEIIRSVFLDYHYQSKQTFLCGRSYSASSNQKYDVYTCRNCRKEVNSILCGHCFGKCKQKNHSYDIVRVKSGICDCGDTSKWSEETFCSAHTCKTGVEAQWPLAEGKGREFKDSAGYLIKLLCWVYQYLARFRSDHLSTTEGEKESERELQMVAESLVKLIDDFGSALMGQLISVNKNRSAVNALTAELLSESMEVANFPHLHQLLNMPKEVKSVELKKMLFVLTDLDQTSEKCVELFIILICRNEKLREEITIQFMRRYTESSSFARGGYRGFSPQLLSNSFMVSDLSKRKELPLFTISCQTDWKSLSHREIRRRVDEIKQYYACFVADLAYLIKLELNCAKRYWEYFCEKRGFVAIASYRDAYCDPKAMGIFNNLHYGIENKFLTKFITILTVFMAKPSSAATKPAGEHHSSLKLLISQLFEKILNETERGEDDLLFSYERMWALSVYAFLLMSIKGEDKCTFSRISDNEIKVLYPILQSQFTSKDALEKLRKLLRRLLRYFLKVDICIYSSEDRASYQAFGKSYFQGSGLLTSIDSIFFTIILKLADYVETRLSQRAPHSKTQVSEQRPKIVIEEIDQLLDEVEYEIEQSLEKNRNSVYNSRGMVAMKVFKLINFVTRLQECVFSELPDLHLSCHFEEFRSRPAYQRQYNIYYLNILKTLPEGEIEIGRFRDLVRYLLFEEDDVLKKFVAQIKVDEASRFLKNQNCKGEKVNLTNYHSLQLKIKHSEVSSLFPKYSIHCYPYQIMPQCGSILAKTEIVRTVIRLFEKLTRDYSVNEYWGKCINELVRLMWRCPRFDGDLKYFSDYFKTKHPEGNFDFIKYLDPELRNEIQRDTLSSDDDENSEIDPEDSEDSESESNYDQRHKEYKRQQILQESESSVKKSMDISFSQTEEEDQENLEILQKTLICVTCRRTSTIDAELFQFCYVSQKTMLPLYGLQPGQKALAFASCLHYSHKGCFIFSKQEGKCPKCNFKFNFFLKIEQSLNFTNMDMVVESEIEDLFREIKIAAQSKVELQMEVQIFRSIIMFLLFLVSVPDKKELLVLNIHTYKNLFHLLKKYFAMKTKEQLYLFRDQIRQTFIKVEDKSHVTFINYLIQSLAQNLLSPLQFNPQAYYFLSITMNDKRILLQFLDNMMKTQIVFSKKLYLQSDGQLRLLKLEKNLMKLEQSYSGTCLCQRQESNNVFFVCLTHRSFESEVKYCNKCYPQKLRRHIEESHQSEALTLRTDNGEIYYFRLENQELMVLKTESIYVNTLQEIFNPDKLEDKSQFWLHQEYYDKVCSNYYSGRYAIHNKLRVLQD